ncbi:hypothetical protein [Ralstonia sp.]|uniref:hypothetical protein n=1 Tax=Ralstonia sp. TaxID=54061 RepID=UPI00257C0CFB|nr:hypothetical protein [Ralstonia sp.]MBA4203220.1 hypothetical protein [Ralstonia sp.]
MTTDDLMRATFSPGRAPRSPEYMAGCRALLDLRAAGKRDGLHCPWPEGSVQSDAWFAGAAEGIIVWREAAQ